MSIKKFLIIAIILSLFTVAAASAVTVQDATNSLIEENGYENALPQESSVFAKYEKGDDIIAVLYTGKEVTMKDLSANFTEKTINNTKGFYSEEDGEYNFAYNCGDEGMIIKVTDKDMIPKIVLGNDPI